MWRRKALQRGDLHLLDDAGPEKFRSAPLRDGAKWPHAGSRRAQTHVRPLHFSDLANQSFDVFPVSSLARPSASYTLRSASTIPCEWTASARAVTSSKTKSSTSD